MPSGIDHEPTVMESGVVVDLDRWQLDCFRSFGNRQGLAKGLDAEENSGCVLPLDDDLLLVGCDRIALVVGEGWVDIQYDLIALGTCSLR